MPKKPTTPNRPPPHLGHHCRECAYAYDHHDQGADGRLILCRCLFDEATKRGKWCKFLNDRACPHFQPITKPTTKQNDNNPNP